MNAILLAVIFTVAVFVDFFWEPLTGRFKNPDHGKYLKVLVGVILISVGWWQAVLQYQSDKQSDADTDFLKQQLTNAVHIGTNSSQTILAMQSELSRLQSKTDQDVVAQLNTILTSLVPDKGHASYSVGVFAMNTSRQMEAERYLRRSLAANPNHSLAHNNLGIILKEKGDLAGARRHFEQALEVEKGNTPAAGNLIPFLAKDGKIAELLGILETATNRLSECQDEVLLQHANVLIVGGRGSNSWVYFDQYVRQATAPDITNLVSFLKSLDKPILHTNLSILTNWVRLLPISESKVLSGFLADLDKN